MKSRRITLLSLFVLIALVISSCGVLSGRRTPDIAKFDNTGELSSFLEQKKWTFILERVIGASVPPTFNGYGYTVNVNDDNLSCHLPFFGRAYRATIGGGNPMDFETKISEYRIQSDDGQDKIDLYISSINDQRNEVRFNCSIFTSGYVYINMLSSDTESITYVGHIYKTVQDRE